VWLRIFEGVFWVCDLGDGDADDDGGGWCTCEGGPPLRLVGVWPSGYLLARRGVRCEVVDELSAASCVEDGLLAAPALGAANHSAPVCPDNPRARGRRSARAGSIDSKLRYPPCKGCNVMAPAGC
jgi:hypothetical protein